MSLQHHYRPINPRLGTHYAIFCSVMVAVVLVLAILEQLGMRKLWISHIMIAVPLVLFLGVAAITRTLDLHEFLAAGRRMPSVYGGLSIAATAIGGAGFFALTGSLYLIGFDALSLILGGAAGFVFTAMLITPYLRKSGAYTLPGFFRQRFSSPLAGALAALLLIPSALLLLAAELRIGGFVTSLFASVSFELAVASGAGLIALITILGGMRSLSWTQCVQYIVVIGAFLLPITVLSVQVTNLPLPQLTYGDLLDRVASQEIAIGASQTNAVSLKEALPGERPEPALKPFLAPFGAIAISDFLMLIFCFMCGTAAMPSLIMRAGTAPSIYEARRAIGWGALFFGLFLISSPAYAVFAKFLTLQEIVGSTPSQLPGWIAGLRDAGLADFSDSNNDGVISAAEMLVSRDGVTLALPIIAGFPFVVVVLVAIGGVSAAMAAAAAHALTIGTSFAEDVYSGFIFRSATPGKRMIAARLGIIGATLSAAIFVAMQDFDILPAIAWSMSLTGATFLPGIVLSLWWARMNVWGLIAAMITGFGTTASFIILTEFSGYAPWFGISNMLAAIFGVPAGLIAGLAVSLLTPAPVKRIIAMADEIRDPTGETIQDRATRVAAQAEAVQGEPATEGGA